VFNSIQVTNYWFNLHCALGPSYQQAQTSSFNIQGISDQDVTLSSNNNNNYHYVSVIQICVSELTTCKTLVLYNTYIVVLVFTDIDVNSVLKVDQQQLALYAHFSQTMIILSLLSDNVLFVQTHITLQQMRTHQLSYINTILIQSQNVLISDSCTDCQKHSMMSFLQCCCTSKHFSECCSNCK